MADGPACQLQRKITPGPMVDGNHRPISSSPEGGVAILEPIGQRILTSQNFSQRNLGWILIEDCMDKRRRTKQAASLARHRIYANLTRRLIQGSPNGPGSTPSEDGLPMRATPQIA